MLLTRASPVLHTSPPRRVSAVHHAYYWHATQSHTLSLRPPGNLLFNLVNNDGTLITIYNIKQYITVCCSGLSNTCTFFGASIQTLYATPLHLTSNLQITQKKLPTDFGVPGYWRFLETAATKKRRIKKEIKKLRKKNELLNRTERTTCVQ